MGARRAAECDLAEAALADALRHIGVTVDERGYCATVEDNLIPAVTPELWARARHDLDDGKGTELAWKFRAAYSSSALVTNTYVPMTGGIDIPGVGLVAGEVRLEQERSGGARGYWPTLDVIVEGEDLDLFVESKCREYLGTSNTAFSVAWPRLAYEHLPAAAARIYGDLYASVHPYDPFDAPQMLKDVLAAEKTARDNGRSVVLVYAYWEPADADAWPIFAQHRDCAAATLVPMQTERVQVLAFSYRDLWDHWESVGVSHVAQLRDRYDVPLTQPGAT